MSLRYSYLGIDPGASGGFALLQPEGAALLQPDGEDGTGAEAGSYHLATTKMPSTPLEVWQCLRDAIEQCRPCKVVIEKVTGYRAWSPRDSKTEDGAEPKNRQPGSAMFNFGKSYGGLQMAVTALVDLHTPVTGLGEVALTEVVARTWQAVYALPPRERRESKESWKRRLKELAQRLFPQAHITLSTCDAVLLAEYLRRRDVLLTQAVRPRPSK